MVDGRQSTTNGCSYEACCFDFDGLLVGTAAQWARAYKQACTNGGGLVSRIDLAPLQGASVPAAAAALSHQVGVPIDPTQLLHALTEAFRSALPSVLPGAKTLLDALVGATRLIVVTNGPGTLVEESLTLLGLYHYFDSIVSADRVSEPKPAPDVYLAACREAGVSPCDAVAFEDSPTGARSARSAGLRVVGVPTSAEPLDADLVVARLDDSQVLLYLGLA